MENCIMECQLFPGFFNARKFVKNSLCHRDFVVHLQGETCCWVCNTCLDYEYMMDEYTCKDCGVGRWPNRNKTACYDIEVRGVFFHWFDFKHSCHIQTKPYPATEFHLPPSPCPRFLFLEWMSFQGKIKK